MLVDNVTSKMFCSCLYYKNKVRIGMVDSKTAYHKCKPFFMAGVGNRQGIAGHIHSQFESFVSKIHILRRKFIKHSCCIVFYATKRACSGK